jgi:hypothetical protein
MAIVVTVASGWVTVGEIVAVTVAVTGKWRCCGECGVSDNDSGGDSGDCSGGQCR